MIPLGLRGYFGLLLLLFLPHRHLNLMDLNWHSLGGLGLHINYLLFFTRHGLSAQGFSKTTVAYATATTLTYVTICLCQFGSIMMRRVKPGHKLLTSYLWSNPKLFIAFGISLTLMLSLIYVPFMQPYFGTAALHATDWLCALAAATLFVTIRQGVFRMRSKES